MATSLRVLILEDDEADAALMLHELNEAGFQSVPTRVDDEAGFRSALDPPPDLICSDYSMPQFDALRALAVLKERGLDVPFIIVSGSIGEEQAVAAMRLGATDYLLKDRLARFGLAVRQALEQKRLRDEKSQLDQTLKNYLAMLAHELRNPLAPLLMSLEVVRQAATNVRERQQALETMGRSIRQLTRLVDDLLEATRVSQGRIDLRTDRVDLARVARSAAEDRRRLFEQAGLQLAFITPETPVWVTGDETRLAQCLHNLLDNAVRFSNWGGVTRLTVAAEEQQAIARVQDNGIGMEPVILGTLFRPFSQADRSLDRPRGGLGLGLSVVKALMEAQRGTVEAASDGPDRGATFTLRLPLEQEPPALTVAPTGVKAAQPKCKVLVIEDNRDAAASLELLLELLGKDVQVAYTGPEGVAKATAWGPDLVLCDIGLPGLDGFGVAAALRRHPAVAGARLIAVTGYGAEEDRQRASEAGFDLLLRKPVEPEQLEQALAGETG